MHKSVEPGTTTDHLFATEYIIETTIGANVHFRLCRYFVSNNKVIILSDIWHTLQMRISTFYSVLFEEIGRIPLAQQALLPCQPHSFRINLTRVASFIISAFSHLFAFCAYWLLLSRCGEYPCIHSSSRSTLNKKALPCFENPYINTSVANIDEDR